LIEFENSDALNTWVAEQTGGACLLSFSCGKDSIAAWLQLRRFFPRIVPVYMYLVPDLAFVEKSLAYYEQVFETKILRLPHPSLYRLLNNLTFQAPENCRTVEEAGLQNFDYDDVFTVAKSVHGLPPDTYTAIGVRATDSLNRWSAIKKYGAVNEKRRTFYPIYDWSKDQLIQAIARAGVKLPVDYRWFGRSFDGIDYRFLRPIKENAPKDYKKILEWFPLAEVELKRMQFREEYYD
jgi:3'-phosphoadenosine 5'-phosphosulfate sulfotransferase (PAPS reductase)/FAD synthetase